MTIYQSDDYDTQSHKFIKHSDDSPMVGAIGQRGGHRGSVSI